jgi:L-ascorbate metabolism protein UlaG (beta-lactamase superfamily)
MRGIFKSLGGRQSNERLSAARRSGHFENGVFLNSVPTHIIKPGSFWRTVRHQLFGKERRSPEKPIPFVTLTKSDFEKPANAGVNAIWIGHASVLVEISGRYVLTDPIWSERASPCQNVGPKRFFPPPVRIEDLPDVDAVVISHDHYDHLDMDTVVALSKRDTRFIVPLGVGAHLEAWRVPSRNITELNWNESVRVRDLTITATPARHYSGRHIVDNNRTLWASFVISSPHHRVFFSGDSGYFDGFKQIGADHGPFDMTLMKVGACGPTWPDIHMTPEQAILAHQDVLGMLLLPVHWGTFNLAFHDWNDPAIRSLRAARSAGVRISLPKPGATVSTNGHDHLDEWWI